jgi:hypothetical protein
MSDRYYGLGIEIARPWIVQSFSFGGYAGKVGYLPRRRMTMVVVTTLGEQSDPDMSPADAVSSLPFPVVTPAPAPWIAKPSPFSSSALSPVHFSPPCFSSE